MKLQRLLLSAGLLASLGVSLALAIPSSTAAGPQGKDAKPAAVWKVDPVHSTVMFKIKHMGTSWFYARFNTFKGSVTYAPDAPESAKVEFEVDVGSVDTGNADRDKHLRTAEFFDAAQFKTATFKSKKVAKADKGLKVTGDLSIHGVTKEVALDIEPTGTGKGFKGEDLAGFHGTLQIKRGDFGMKTYEEALGDDVTLQVSLECGKE